MTSATIAAALLNLLAVLSVTTFAARLLDKLGPCRRPARRCPPISRADAHSQKGPVPGMGFPHSFLRRLQAAPCGATLKVRAARFTRAGLVCCAPRAWT